MNADIGQAVIQCVTCLDYQCTQLQEKALQYEIPYKPWEVVVADVFMVNNITPMYCRLLQQVPNCAEGSWSLSRQPN